MKTPLSLSAAALLAAILALPNAAQARTVERTTAGTAKPLPLPSASATLDCGGGVKITVTDGNKGGHCSIDPSGTSATCKDAGANLIAHASCKDGCIATDAATCSTTR